MMFSLRYENDPEIGALKDSLRHAGVSQTQIDLIDSLIGFGGSSSRKTDLFQNQNKSIIANITRTVKQTFKVIRSQFKLK